MSELTIGLLVLLTYAPLIIGILLFFRGSHCWDDDDLRQESIQAIRQSTHPDSSR